MRTVQLRSGEQVSAIGQGTWYMGDRKSEAPAKWRRCGLASISG